MQKILYNLISLILKRSPKKLRIFYYIIYLYSIIFFVLLQFQLITEQAGKYAILFLDCFIEFRK